MKTMNLFFMMAGGVLLSMSGCRDNNSSADTIKDTTLNQDTAYRTDTFIRRDADPRYQGIEGDIPADSIRVRMNDRDMEEGRPGDPDQ